MPDDAGKGPGLEGVLRSVAAQLMNGPEVVITEAGEPEQKIQVTRVGSGRLRTVRVRINGRDVQAIEQNRQKPSRWGELARRGIRWCSFRTWRRGSI
jgi:hypothetical protein